MGKNNKSQLLGILSLTTIVAIAPLFSSAQTSTSANCIQREDQIPDAPKIKTFVAKLGGMKILEGDWKLAGLAGRFKRVQISFESANDGMKALIDGLDNDGSKPNWGAIAVCDTVRTDTLHVKVLKTKDQLYMRQGSGGTLELAQIENGKVGTFYSFKKF